MRTTGMLLSCTPLVLPSSSDMLALLTSNMYQQASRSRFFNILKIQVIANPTLVRPSNAHGHWGTAKEGTSSQVSLASQR